MDTEKKSRWGFVQLAEFGDDEKVKKTRTRGIYSSNVKLDIEQLIEICRKVIDLSKEKSYDDILKILEAK